MSIRVFICHTGYIAILALLQGRDELKDMYFQMDNCCCMDAKAATYDWKPTKECTDDSNPDTYCTDIEHQDECGNRSTFVPPDAPFRIRTALIPFANTRYAGRVLLASLTDEPPTATHETAFEDPTQCEKECSDGGPFCLRVELSDTDSMVSKVGGARQMLRDEPTRIPQERIEDLFGVSEDPWTSPSI